MRLPLEKLAQKYQGNVYRAAFSICKNSNDAEDVMQETFLTYYKKEEQQFINEEHIKAWLLRVAINQAKNLKHSFWHKNRQNLEDYMQEISFEAPEDRELFWAVMALPENYRTIIHLFYYEDYSIKEISDILHVNENTVKTRLHRGRMLLKDKF